MSAIISERAWYPPAFPAQGRLPTQAALVGQNSLRQESLETAYRQQLSLAVGRRVEPPCCKTLHIYCYCTNTAYGHSFVMNVTFSHTLSPSALNGQGRVKKLIDALPASDGKWRWSCCWRRAARGLTTRGLLPVPGVTVCCTYFSVEEDI